MTNNNIRNIKEQNRTKSPENLEMKDVRDFIVDELKNSKKLRKIHLQEAFENFLVGDSRTGLLMLRNLVNATCGFQVLAHDLQISSKSLMRMLSYTGNPTSDNIFKIIAKIAHYEDYSVRLKFA